MTQTVVYYTDSAGFGGAELALLTLLSGLDRDRWRPVLFHHGYTGVGPLVDRARSLGVSTREVPALPGRRDWKWISRFGRMLRSERASIFHAHLPWPLSCTYALFAAAVFRTSGVLATQHLYAPLETTRTRRLQKMVSLCVDRYIAVSENLARDLRLRVLRPGKVVVVRNSVALQSFRNRAVPGLRASLTSDATRPIVLTSARLEPQKGLTYLLAAAKMVPQALFVVAGEGQDAAALKAQARSLGLNSQIQFLGFRTDVADLLDACDLFVLPSLFEGLPISVLEAMAAGKPVVATRIGGTDEAVEDGVTGYLVPARNPEALAGAIQEILANPAGAARMGEAGRARTLKEFSAESMVRRTTELYEELA